MNTENFSSIVDQAVLFLGGKKSTQQKRALDPAGVGTNAASTEEEPHRSTPRLHSSAHPVLRDPMSGMPAWFQGKFFRVEETESGGDSLRFEPEIFHVVAGVIILNHAK